MLWYLPLWAPTPANPRCRDALAALDEVVHRLIARRRAQKIEGSDLLSMLLHARDEETGESMSDGQLRDEVVTLLLGGHDTTAVKLHDGTRVACLKKPEALVLDGHVDGYFSTRHPRGPKRARLPLASEYSA